MFLCLSYLLEASIGQRDLDSRGILQMVAFLCQQQTSDFHQLLDLNPDKEL